MPQNLTRLTDSLFKVGTTTYNRRDVVPTYDDVGHKVTLNVLGVDVVLGAAYTDLTYSPGSPSITSYEDMKQWIQGNVELVPMVISAVDVAKFDVNGTQYDRRDVVITLDTDTLTIEAVGETAPVVDACYYRDLRRVDESTFDSSADVSAFLDSYVAFSGLILKNEGRNCLNIGGYYYGMGHVHPFFYGQPGGVDVRPNCICIRNAPRDLGNIINNTSYTDIFLDDSAAPCADYEELKTWVKDNFWKYTTS